MLFRSAVEREVFEESAMTVTAVRQVATFRRTGFRPHVSPVFRCVVVAGDPRPNDEAVDARFHAIDRLPWGTFPWLREAIDLAVADLRMGTSGVATTPNGTSIWDSAQSPGRFSFIWPEFRSSASSHRR